MKGDGCCALQLSSCKFHLEPGLPAAAAAAIGAPSAFLLQRIRESIAPEARLEFDQQPVSERPRSRSMSVSVLNNDGEAGEAPGTVMIPLGLRKMKVWT